jgi:dTDP-glucose pyrophosphorylase
MDKGNFEYLFVDLNASILSAMKQMDKTGRKLLIVQRGEKYFSMLSIGDIQRALLKNYSTEIKIAEILRPKVTKADVNDSWDHIRELVFQSRSEYMPVVDDNNNVVKVIFWEDLFSPDEKRINKKLNIPVVIMAGGEGKRLRPITNVLPKPLIPIGDRTILENIMDRFVNVGCNEFLMTVNFKAEMIRHYFEVLNNPLYRISYFEEIQPLGTAGSLSLLKEKINETFFVSNCDIIIDADYSEILDYHQKNNNELTLVSAIKHYPIPYGTIETGDNGKLLELKEKPEVTFQINSGMYILEPEILADIPENTFFHITHLIEKIINRKGRVGVFPVSQGSWKDIGNWAEYLQEIKINEKEN